MLKRTILAICLTFVLAPPASAKTGTIGHTSSGLSSANRAALVLPRVEGLRISHAICPGYDDADVVACADPEQRILYLPKSVDRFTYLHEYAHVWEAAKLTDTDRAWLTHILGFKSDAPWFRDEAGMTDPGEVFADAFATCHMPRLLHRVGRDGVERGSSVDGYEWNPTARQRTQVCGAIALWAAR